METILAFNSKGRHCPWEKVFTHLFPREAPLFLRVLGTRGRVVRSSTLFIHSLLRLAHAGSCWLMFGSCLAHVWLIGFGINKGWLTMTALLASTRYEPISDRAYETLCPSRLEPHRVLRIPKHEVDTLRIIFAAQVQQRQWRQLNSADVPAILQQRVHQIVVARQTMVQRVLQQKMRLPKTI